jgi:ribosomal protein S28E/S33
MTVSGEPSSVRRPRLWPVFVTFAVGAPVAIIAVVGLGPILRGNADFVTAGAGGRRAGWRRGRLTRARFRLQRGRASGGVLAASALGTVALSQVLGMRKTSRIGQTQLRKKNERGAS